MIAGPCFLAVLLIGGFICHGVHRADRANLISAHIAEVDSIHEQHEKDHAALCEVHSLAIRDALDGLAKAQQQHRDQETLLLVAAAEIDRLTLGQPVAKRAHVYEFPAGGRG